MKLIRFPALCAATGGLFLVASFSNTVRATQPRLDIQETVEAKFPAALLADNITKGDAWVMISLDADGVLTDALPIRYTHRAFADEAMRVLKQWRFEPVLVLGRPIAIRTDVHFAFEATGCVISVTPTAAIQELAAFANRPDYITPMCRPDELDNIPTAIRTVSPQIPAKPAEEGVIGGKAVIDFVIDETGQPRMPVLVSAAHEEFANQAAGALSQWRFTPPTRRGKPVAVQVRQEFLFPSNSGAPAEK
jgi:TonB family protein